MGPPPGETPCPAPEILRTLWARAFEIVLVLGDDGAVLDANPRAVEAYGRSLAELRTMKIHDLRARTTREDVPTQLTRALEEGIAFETEHVRADGTTFPVEVSSSRAEIDGSSVLFSVIRDVTLRREMQAKLAEADRLAVVGTLAAGVAHEVNNPLTYASASLELAIRDLRSERDPVRIIKLLNTATDGLERVRVIVRDLMSLAYREVRDLTPVDVTSILDSCVNLASHELHARARVVRDYASVPAVLADGGRLGQVFLNLIINAAQAIPADRPIEHGEVRLEVRTTTTGEVEVRIGDNGVGIAPTQVERMFDPFVTTKGSGQGLGLGLYISRSLVESMNGTISVRSEEGRGSTFLVTLPPASAAHPGARASGQKQLAPRTVPPLNSTTPKSRGRVLVVDDEPMIGRVLATALRPDHDVLVVEDAFAALKAIETDAFDAVLCDIGLPGRSGLEFLDDVTQRQPALVSRVVLMTGGSTTDVRAAVLQRGITCLNKPFTLEDVLEALGVALASSGDVADRR